MGPEQSLWFHSNSIFQYNELFKPLYTISLTFTFFLLFLFIKDSHGDTKRLKLKTREALSLPQGERVVVEFDCLDPIGEAQGLLVGVCGLLETDCTIFSISFDKWSYIPKSYFNDCFNNIIKPYFCFMTVEEVAREYVYRSIAKKWAASITRDQWTSFVNYRYKEETQNMCKRNAENRKKQTVPHTGGSKPNSRRRAEMVKDVTLFTLLYYLNFIYCIYFFFLSHYLPFFLDNPGDTASGPVSPTDAKRSSGASNPSDSH
nr:uncharacterized protein LOC104119166 [Nicotiana tomentosiformis]